MSTQEAEADEHLTETESTYHLMGVLVHSGLSCDEGHYFSVIRDRAADGGWYTFDDATVEPFDENGMDAFFGGEGKGGADALAVALVYEREAIADM